MIYALLAALALRLLLMLGWHHPDLLYIHNIDAGWPHNYYQPLVYIVYKTLHLILPHGTPFWMKMEYLLLEIPIVAIIWQFKDKRMLWLWLFNPIVLWACYAFGQYRMLTCLVGWLFVWLWWRGNRKLSMIAFGMLCSVEVFPWVLAPIVVMSQKGERFISAIIILATFLLLHGYDIQVIGNTPALQGIFASHHTWNVLVKWAGAFAMLYVYWLSLKSTATIRLCTLAILVIYATGPVVPHYLMWILPFALFLKEPAPCG